MRSTSWLCIAIALVLSAEAVAQGAVRGSVRDGEGTPVAGARVSAGGRATVTDPTGGFLLRSVPAGERRVEATLLGHHPAVAVIDVPRDGERTVTLVLVATVLELPALRVESSPGSGDPGGMAQATTHLSGRALDRELGGSLAATLAAHPGVAVRSMGPAASMPVLRGLSGDRILVLHDGQRTGDLAGSADDHATTVDPLAAGRVEIVRGPAALLFGNNALGGVVNVVTDDLPTRRPARAEWGFSALTESALPGGGASVRVAAPVGTRSAVTARFGARSAGEMRLPGYLPLANTSAGSHGGALGAAWLGGPVEAGATLRGHAFSYGLPVPPGSDPVRLEGRREEAQARLWSGRMRVDAGAQRYGHDEIDADSGELLQRFSLRTGTLGLLFGGETGSIGATLLLKEHDVHGEAALTPPASSIGGGAFAYREARVGALLLQAGARADGFRVRSATTPSFGEGHTRTFGALTGSAGARLPLAGGASLSASVSRAFRAPTVEELFSAAAHAGTGAVELGDPGLRVERATAVEVGGVVERSRWALHAAAYRTRITDYVHLVSLGDTTIGGATLPVLAYAQEAATLAGLEGSAEFAATPSLVLGLTADAVRGTLVDGTPLSWMPAPRVGAGVRWESGVLSLATEARHAFAQERVGAADELPTAAYTLVRASGGVRFRSAGGIHTVTLRIENAGDTSYREATSRIRDFAPGPGRSVSLLYRWIR
jgi:iron complex outermembrane recepter protein